MKRYIYNNPILQFDFSDPDVIRVGSDFFMVASSFNHTPGVPVLHSKNLVEWKIINYVFDEIPFKRFNEVCHGDGAWAPSIRYHDGMFYVIIPFPDEGIYVAKTKDPFKGWSKLHCLIKAKGVIDPCPIWTDGKCYLAVGFAKSRIGFNSVIGIYEVSLDLENVISDYRIVYDGHDQNPTIEGPKFNYRNGFYYIMCPAGSVKGGWQVALRSKHIYGPYESKVVLMQNGTKINGPHQGALIDIDDNDNWAFIHFQDMWAYGRIIHLEPVNWYNDWPLCGDVKDPLLAGAPVSEAYYPINIQTGDHIQISDDFKGDKLSLMWQTPANKKEDMYELGDGLILNCIKTPKLPLHLVPQVLTTKIPALSFTLHIKLISYLKENEDEAGIAILGEAYTYFSIYKKDDKTYLRLVKGTHHGDEEVIWERLTNQYEFDFKVYFENKNIYDLYYQYEVNGTMIGQTFKAMPGRWIGTTYGLFARGQVNGGFTKIKFVHVNITK